MIKNYFKTAFRNLWRNKNFTFINIAGLGVGIAVCILIFLIIQFELSFDNFHSKKDRIYRVLTVLNSEDGSHRSSGVPYPLPTAIKADFSKIKSTGVYSYGNDQILIPYEKTGQAEKKFKEETGVFFAGPEFFEIFDYPLIAGEYKSLKDPNTAVITKQTAEKYFGNWRSAIGKSFKRNGRHLYKITGVLDDIPANTDMQIKIVGSYSTFKDFTESTDWNSVSSNHRCYLLFPENMTAAQMDQQLTGLVKKYKKPEDQEERQIVQSLAEVHYDEEPGNFLDRTISKRLITTLWMIAGFILLIACVNFINLSTAQAVNRSKEIGVRKVLGSNKRQLRFQFYSETALITVMAILLAIGLTVIAFPFIGKILDLPLSFSLMENPVIILFFIVLGIVVVFLAGFYPAIVLSRFNPIAALKNKVTVRRSRGISLRRGLVVFQFIIAQALIIGTLVIVRQMHYFQSKPLGFDKNAVINVAFPTDSASLTKIDFLKNELLSLQGVKSVSFSYGSPADEGNWYSNFRFNKAAKDVDWGANLKWADANYLKTYNIQLVAGRNVQPSDTVREFLVNETWTNRMGLKNPQEALNKEINMWDGQLKGNVVGVVKDFNAVSLREAMVPVMISTAKDFYSFANIKMQTESITDVLKKTEAIWNKAYPEYVYEPRFLDEKIKNFYTQENRLASLYKIFAALAIFLSCLGLYGLASFMAVQRVKEVGIRKVLGASVGNIVMLFSKEFLLLIGIAFIIATPIAWYYMQNWLQDFVYRIDISWWILAISGLLAVVIALITISFKAIAAALANPVKNLRTE